MSLPSNVKCPSDVYNNTEITTEQKPLYSFIDLTASPSDLCQSPSKKAEERYKICRRHSNPTNVDMPTKKSENDSELKNIVHMNKDGTSIIRPDQLVDSPLNYSKRKKVQALYSSDEDKPLIRIRKNKKRNLGRSKVEINPPESRKELDQIKKCQVIADRLTVPDNYVYGAILQTLKSKNSRHPYKIKKWLLSEIEIKWSQPSKRATPKTMAAIKGLPPSERSSLLLLDALKTSNHICSDDRSNEFQVNLQNETCHNVEIKGIMNSVSTKYHRHIDILPI